jgi:dipeptidyl aminopeptidase/acylaminoacyl peptidase
MTVMYFLLCGCGHQTESDPGVSLINAKNAFITKIVKDGNKEGAPDCPDGKLFKMVHFESKVGRLAAYVTPDPGDGKKHPAVVWITGGDTNSIGDVWTPRDESNDQSASPLWKNGLVVMFPSQRGGNDNPGHREGFYGEVDDIIDATKYLSKLQYVDSSQMYLGGHSTGGTLAMLVGESTDMYKAVFSLGPVSDVSHYGDNFRYYDVRDQREVFLRSPINWLSAVVKPMFVFEGLVRQDKPDRSCWMKGSDHVKCL